MHVKRTQRSVPVELFVDLLSDVEDCFEASEFQMVCHAADMPAFTVLHTFKTVHYQPSVLLESYTHYFFDSYISACHVLGQDVDHLIHPGGVTVLYTPTESSP